MLLQHRADVCLRTPSTGLTALHIAARTGSTRNCKLLLDADRRTLELRACDGRTPVFEAAFNGHLPVVELLHESYSANLFAVDDYGATLLHTAV
jgi:ankyrin repeat protein